MKRGEEELNGLEEKWKGGEKEGKGGEEEGNRGKPDPLTPTSVQQHLARMSNFLLLLLFLLSSYLPVPSPLPRSLPSLFYLVPVCYYTPYLPCTKKLPSLSLILLSLLLPASPLSLSLSLPPSKVRTKEGQTGNTHTTHYTHTHTHTHNDIRKFGHKFVENDGNESFIY